LARLYRDSPSLKSLWEKNIPSKELLRFSSAHNTEKKKRIKNNFIRANS
jgi:hypothetical protein